MARPDPRTRLVAIPIPHTSAATMKASWIAPASASSLEHGRRHGAAERGEMGGEPRRHDRRGQGDAERLAGDPHLREHARCRPHPPARHRAEHRAAVGAHEQALTEAEQDEPPDEVRWLEVDRQRREAEEGEDHERRRPCSVRTRGPNRSDAAPLNGATTPS